MWPRIDKSLNIFRIYNDSNAEAILRETPLNEEMLRRAPDESIHEKTQCQVPAEPNSNGGQATIP